LLIEGALLLTLALFLSTRMPVIAGGVIGVAVLGAGWLAGPHCHHRKRDQLRAPRAIKSDRDACACLSSQRRCRVKRIR
jgi:hypothetical protein